MYSTRNPARERFAAWVGMALAVAVIGIIAGCGGGTPAAPEGQGLDESASLSGQLVDAGDTTQGISNAYVYVPAGAAARQIDTAVVDTYTDENGNWTLKGLVPGAVSLIVIPPEDSGYSVLDLTVEAGSGSQSIRVTTPTVEAAAQIDTIEISPSRASLAPGNTTRFQATVFDAAGQALPLTPTWTTRGRIGTIDGEGMLQAADSPVGGMVVASVASYSAAAPVTVTPNGGSDDDNSGGGDDNSGGGDDNSGGGDDNSGGGDDDGNSPSDPVIQFAVASTDNVWPGRSAELYCIATDADGDALSYTWTPSSGNVEGSGPQVTWKAGANVGSHTVTVVVEDATGRTATADVDLQVSTTAPRIRSLDVDPATVAPGGTSTITVEATAPGGDALSFAWSATGGSVSGSDGTATWTAPNEVGEYLALVAITDGDQTTMGSVLLTVE